MVDGIEAQGHSDTLPSKSRVHYLSEISLLDFYDVTAFCGYCAYYFVSYQQYTAI